MYENKDLEASLKCFKDLKIPNRHRSGLLCQVMMSCISKTDSDRDLGCQLMASAKKDGLFTDINYLDVSFPGILVVKRAQFAPFLVLIYLCVFSSTSTIKPNNCLN